MMIRAILISAAILSVCSTALAQSGSPAEQEACRPDVRKFCHKIKMAELGGGGRGGGRGGKAKEKRQRDPAEHQTLVIFRTAGR